MKRAKDFPQSFPKVHVFSSFFVKTLKQGFDRVKRWTKNTDLFSKDLVIIPVHLPGHWASLVINFSQKIIEYYDSLGNKNPSLLKV